MNLLIISHTPHYRQDGKIVGWGPTVREIDQLAVLFARIIHLAVLYEEAAPLSSLPYTAPNVDLVTVKPAGGNRWVDKLNVVCSYPGYWEAIRAALARLDQEDVIHVRCPANLSLLAVMHLSMETRHPWRWIKYAGNWRPHERDSRSYAFQRWLLQRDLARSLVTVNGRWPDQPAHIQSFDNPSLGEFELGEGRQVAVDKQFGQPIQLLFVGALERGKGVYETIEIAQLLRQAHLDFELDIIGDGLERPALECSVKRLGLECRVIFHGWMPQPQVAEFYSKGHFLVFPTKSEGWPKALSEGMAYGVVPLAGAVSSIPQVLQECGTGMSLDPTNPQVYVNAILAYAQDPERWKRESLAACRAASRFTYQAYIKHLKTVFADRWGLTL